MKTIRLFSTILVFAALLSAGAADASVKPDRYGGFDRHNSSASGYDIKDTVKKVFSAERGGTLEIDADLGNVEVKSGKNSEVRVIVERIVDVDSKEEAKALLESHNLVIDRKGSAVWVHSRVDKDRGPWRRSMDRIRIRIIVEVPDEFNLEVSSGAGNVSVVDVEGVANIRTGAGNVVLSRTAGTTEVVSGSGNIEVRTAEGGIKIRNGSGNVILDDVQGKIEAETGAGNITARIVDELDGDSILRTSAGNINVQIADNIGANVRAVARVGSCSTDFPLQVTGSWMKKSFDGAINGGGPDLTLRSNVGNVVLTRLD